MEPHYKAKELIQAYKGHLEQSDSCFAYTEDERRECDRLCTGHGCPLWDKYSKKFALIAVDEIIKVVPMYTGKLNPVWQFWNEVKTEIEKS